MQVDEFLKTTQRNEERLGVSRRAFLREFRWAPLVFLPSPLRAAAFGASRPVPRSLAGASFPFADIRFAPHYPVKSPLDDVLRKLVPGTDEFVAEKYAYEIGGILREWSLALKTGPRGAREAAKFLNISVGGTRLTKAEETRVRSGYGLEVVRRTFVGDTVSGREPFLDELGSYLGGLTSVETADFEIVGIDEVGTSPLTVQLNVRYNFVGVPATGRGREERIGHWLTQWKKDDSSGWLAVRWEASGETVSRAAGPIFLDVTAQSLGQTASYAKQMLRGVDHWRTVLDGACGIDVYGNNGIAAGDFDGDGFDDLYVCQPAGLPNRLYRNRGDGTFEDVTETAGVGVLDGTACALFADFENKGLQDLLVVCGNGPLLFVNEGGGKFSLKRDAFQFAKQPQGTFTHAAVADYDRDGRLDIYFCLYSYYLGLDQYHYPAPYFDARNGPPNFLFRNAGNGTFEDRTEAAGLNVDNDRYSFACAWGNSGSGGPDLYVANDFGRSNLYRNNGDGTFTSVAAEAGVEDPGAGMSACWVDFDNDGKQEIYVSNMWSAAGIRVSGQKNFHERETEEVRGFYRQHARGNSLYRNQGDGKFKNVSVQAGVDVGRWAWSSDAWDFDHDGYADLYVANGYISEPDGRTAESVDASSFFWRQVVAQSPSNGGAAPAYERGWNAINELIRSDTTWNGYERNVFYANNGDGTFSDISGVVGLDFLDDSRAFALADLDHDGRLEVVLKNRTAPQLRVLRNAMKEIGSAMSFRLRGTKSNRDAIGTAVTVESEGRQQTKYVQAGSGFLSQHSKELFFGLGKTEGTVSATIRWPNGMTQSFEKLPIGNRIEIEEATQNFNAKPFGAASPAYALVREPHRSLVSSSAVETWLIEPLSAPAFSLPDLSDKTHELSSFRGGNVLLNFWIAGSLDCSGQLRLFQRHQSILASSGVRVVAINVDDPRNLATLKSFVEKEKISFPILLATPETAGVYNIVYRYLFDRRRDLGLPTSFLLDVERRIVKVYQGQVTPEHLATDVKSIQRNVSERARRALPFEGTLYGDAFRRNEFTYGVAFYQRGYWEQAAASFRQVIEAKADGPEAYYNLGTLYLRQNKLDDARRYLEQAVKLRPDHAEAWNNLGMIAAQQERPEEAIRDFRQSLQLKPDYVIALVNLGNFYRRQEAYGEADRLLSRAVELEPDDPEVNYSVGMLYARENQLPRATQHLQRAVELRPEYPDALNNLGVLFVRQQRFPDAKEQFETCIRVAPGFDQAYLNLARLYVLLDDKGKAREVLQSLLQKRPEHKVAQQALEMLN
jgi:Flp pilus assembly protein TadD/peroxiredoxin